MGTDLRVAVAGASGIGKHHAKWHHVAGSEVVAFLGSTESSCRNTATVLGELFGYNGRWYCDMDELLARERPDIVDVCTPNHLHSECATAALEAGCHVLCEKPLVWEDGVPAAELLARARQLVHLAEEQGCLLAVCTQYAASLPHYGRLYGLEGGREGPITEKEASRVALAREAAACSARPARLPAAQAPGGRTGQPTPRVPVRPRRCCGSTSRSALSRPPRAPR